MASSNLRLSTAAVRDGADRASAELCAHVEAGGREARWNPNDPVFARVHQDSAFAAELGGLERMVERQRGEVEEDHADERR